MSYFDKLLQVIELLRPKFHNKVTFIVVTAGISLLATPLYQQVLIKLIEKHLGIQLPDENLVSWGGVLVVVGLVYHLLMTVGYKWLSTKKVNVSEQQKVDAQQERVEHDKKIFGHADQIMSGTFLIDFLTWARNDHSYLDSQYETLRKFCRSLASDENIFIATELHPVTNNLLQSSQEFLYFLEVRFFDFPDIQHSEDTKFCMQPDQNIDRTTRGISSADMKFYDSITVELNSLIDDLREKYRVFRAEVKRQLIV